MDIVDNIKKVKKKKLDQTLIIRDAEAHLGKRKDAYRICNISQKSNVKICACALSWTCKPKMAVHPQSAAKESRGFYEEVTAPPSHSKLFVAICVYHIKDIGETFRLVFSITSATQRSNICKACKWSVSV